jgi:hypothetical protein
MCELVCFPFWFGLSLEVAPAKFFSWLRHWWSSTSIASLACRSLAGKKKHRDLLTFPSPKDMGWHGRLSYHLQKMERDLSCLPHGGPGCPQSIRSDRSFLALLASYWNSSQLRYSEARVVWIMSPVDTFCLPELCNRYLLSRECMLTIQAVRRTMCSSRSVIDMTCLDSDVHYLEMACFCWNPGKILTDVRRPSWQNQAILLYSELAGAWTPASLSELISMVVHIRSM